MSVPSWLRSVSKAEFIWRLYRLNIRIGEIVEGHPKKYRANYGDRLIKASLIALNLAQVGNDIYITPSMSVLEYRTRRLCLKMARSYTQAIATIAYIFLELTLKTDGVKAEKILNQEEEIGLECQEISKMIQSVLDSNRKTYREMRKKSKLKQ